MSNFEQFDTQPIFVESKNFVGEHFVQNVEFVHKTQSAINVEQNLHVKFPFVSSNHTPGPAGSKDTQSNIKKIMVFNFNKILDTTNTSIKICS